MSIAVTGAAGFIGANLVRRLGPLSTAPLILVDHPLTPEKGRNVEELDGFRFYDHATFADALDRDALPVSAVFHLGACSDTTEARWDYLLKNNVEYTQRLWRACARQGVPFIYASSAATYGDGSLGFDDRTHPRDLQPLNLYGKSKNDFDIWALDQVDRGEPAPVGWAGLKFFNVYGPHEAHKVRMASMVYHSYNQILATNRVRLFKSTDPAYADGGQLRDFVYVEDNVDHMIWLWRNPHVCGIFNSGTGRARSFVDLVSAVFHALGRDPQIEMIEMPEDLRGKYQNYTQATMTKLRDAGYAAEPTPLERGVAQYVAWLEAHAGRPARAAG